jgi:hypothetical protein
LDVIALFVASLSSVSQFSSSSSIDAGSKTAGSRIALKGFNPFLRPLLSLLSGEEDDDDEDDEAITLRPRDACVVVIIEVFFFREEEEEEELEEEDADEEDKTRRSAFADAIAVILTLCVIL